MTVNGNFGRTLVTEENHENHQWKQTSGLRNEPRAAPNTGQEY